MVRVIFFEGCEKMKYVRFEHAGNVRGNAAGALAPQPLIFLKPSIAVNDPGARITQPKATKYLALLS